jgi:photosystem II stability/assembly factor-like uncharacterized protein
MMGWRRRCLGAGAIAMLSATAALGLHLLREGQAHGSPVKAPPAIVLTLGTESSPAPCNTFWERGSAPDAKHAWVDLHSTSDSGRNWRVVTLTKEADAAMHLHGILDPSNDSLGAAMHSWFITATRGWLVVPRKEGSTVWETDDGARTLRLLPEWFPTNMAFADARHGLALVGTWGPEVEPMLTADAGTTWKPCAARYRAWFHSIFLLDIRRGWAWVAAPESSWDAPSAAGKSDGPNRYGVMRTDDGGCQWRGVWSDQHLLTEFGELYFLDEKQGWLAGGYKGGLYHTADGGHSWQPLPLPAEQMNIKGVYFRDADRGWLITGKEELFETRDGARSWRNLPRSELLARLEELMSLWERWRIGRLYGMLARGGCFTPEELERQLNS